MDNMSKFLQDLSETFCAESADTVRRFMDAMGLPLPGTYDEYMDSLEGSMIFLDRYGLVLRIEARDTSLCQELGNDWQRVNDHPLVLRPLGSVYSPKAVIEVCPAVHVGTDIEVSQKLGAALKSDGVNYFDQYPQNSGYIQQPDGRMEAVVVDRLSCTYLTDQLDAYDQLAQKHSDPQALFDPLREAFDHAMKLPSMKAMRRSLSFFLSKCEDYRKRGHLVCSWHGSAENAYGNIDVKTSQASHAATNYAQRIQPAYV
tara:strand:- start:1444 stop:2217 length:774 start_codon:yes stop_codon:yes gene_type:complete